MNQNSAAFLYANGYGAIALYVGLGVLALWLPRPVAILTALSWLLWLVMSLRQPRGKVGNI